jgi:hypothetical protein
VGFQEQKLKGATRRRKLGYLLDGKRVEQEFAKHFSHITAASDSEDIHQHFDLKIETKFDVKGMKKIRRSDPEPNEDYHYIEILNVHGNKGWLYGEADAFAFETQTYFVLVDKLALQEYIKKTVRKEYVTTPQLHYLYRRSGRQDCMTLVKTLELCGLALRLIHKGDL